jgi:hypothetical protein
MTAQKNGDSFTKKNKWKLPHPVSSDLSAMMLKFADFGTIALDEISHILFQLSSFTMVTVYLPAQ